MEVNNNKGLKSELGPKMIFLELDVVDMETLV